MAQGRRLQSTHPSPLIPAAVAVVQMAPLGAAQRHATADTTLAAKASDVSRGRSRSRLPAGADAKQVRTSRAQGPQLKDWVLVRIGSRFWRDGVPALVSRVTTGLSEGDSTVCLVLPNRLALRHGFGSSKPFQELEGVAFRDIKPYTGSDQASLGAVLLKAIKEFRGAARGRQDTSVPSSSAGAVQSAATDVETVPATQEETSAPTAAPELPMTVEAEADGLRQGEEPGPCDSEAGVANSESSVAAALEQVVPTTPLPRSGDARPLVRNESGPKEAPAAPAPEAAAAAPLYSGKPSSASRHAELTAAVARAFRSCGAMELSRHELEAALAATFGQEELSRGLQALDQENKVFLSGDLVFLI
uniref:Uncharacterized protein n=1 Tax=Alexandrium catenella TaxID=2925 RepID=A0A7S1L6V3_ALECA